jgi:hypothetical protein
MTDTSSGDTPLTGTHSSTPPPTPPPPTTSEPARVCPRCGKSVGELNDRQFTSQTRHRRTIPPHGDECLIRTDGPLGSLMECRHPGCDMWFDVLDEYPTDHKTAAGPPPQGTPLGKPKIRVASNGSLYWCEVCGAEWLPTDGGPAVEGGPWLGQGFVDEEDWMHCPRCGVTEPDPSPPMWATRRGLPRAGGTTGPNRHV